MRGRRSWLRRCGCRAEVSGVGVENFDPAGPFIAWSLVETSVVEDAVVVEAEAEVLTLCSVTDFGETVRKHGFCDTVDESDVANLDVAFDEVCAKCQMAYSSEFIGIAGKKFSCSRICVHVVWLGRLDVEELESQFRVFHSFDEG